MEGNTFSPETTCTSVRDDATSLLFILEVRLLATTNKTIFEWDEIPQLLYSSFIHVDSNSFTKSKRSRELVKFQIKSNNDVRSNTVGT